MNVIRRSATSMNVKQQAKRSDGLSKNLTRGGLFNVDLDEPALFPKVKSTVLSNPKFVSKSRLMMLGTNKYIGGTYRNTTLDQQMLNQSHKSSLDLTSYGKLGGIATDRNSVANYDASNYAPSHVETQTIHTPVESLQALAEVE